MKSSISQSAAWLIRPDETPATVSGADPSRGESARTRARPSWQRTSAQPSQAQDPLLVV